MEFNADMVMSDQDVEPFHRALRLMEHVFRTLLTGSLVENLCDMLKALGTRGTAEPQRPSPEELLRVQMETDQRVTVGPEDEFEPDWGAAPGPRAWSCRPSRRSPWTMAPWRSGTG